MMAWFGAWVVVVESVPLSWARTGSTFAATSAVPQASAAPVQTNIRFQRDAEKRFMVWPASSR